MARTMRYPWLLLKCWLTDTARTSGTVFWICSQKRTHFFFAGCRRNPDIDDVDLSLGFR